MQDYNHPSHHPLDSSEDHLLKELGDALAAGWKKYVALLGEQPHGTAAQMRALVVLSGLNQSPRNCTCDHCQMRAIAAALERK